MEETGDLCFCIGKTDAWGDNGRLLKVGKVRVSIRPNPLGNDVEYRQTLNLEPGEIVFEFGRKGSDRERSTLQIWLDANDPVIYVTLESARASSLTGRIELWRTQRYELPSLEVSDVHLDRSKADQKYAGTIVEPDTILEDLDGRIGWLHHNKKSVGPELTMRIQGLEDYRLDDPLLGSSVQTRPTRHLSYREAINCSGSLMRAPSGAAIQLSSTAQSSPYFIRRGPGDADYSRWGPGYWWQNTRLAYISMCTSGDFDLIKPRRTLSPEPEFTTGTRVFQPSGGRIMIGCPTRTTALFCYGPSRRCSFRPKAERYSFRRPSLETRM